MHQNKTIGLLRGAGALTALVLASSAWGADYGYAGGITLCTGTCDSFAALEDGSSVTGLVSIDVGANDTFVAADISDFGFSIQSEQAIEPFDGTNAATANPLPIVSGIAEVRESIDIMGTLFETGGTTDADGELVSGTILFEFTVSPFSDNAAWVLFDVGTGEAQVCVFFTNAGCIPNATQAVVVAGGFGLIPAANYVYDGDITLCTGTCDSFAALELGSMVDGTVDISVGVSDTFVASDIVDFGFSIMSSEPAEPFDGTNAATANPLPIVSGIAEVRESIDIMGTIFETSGTTDANGELVSGTILFEFTVSPFSDNAAWVLFDVGTGEAQVCVFFTNAGCIPNATQAVVVDGAFSLGGGSPDSDGDGITDDVDNCTETVNASQLDSDGDGYGNACDADFNNDCIVNIVDLGILRTLFFGANNQGDLNGDGITNVVDLGILRSLFFGAPGPSPADPCT